MRVRKGMGFDCSVFRVKMILDTDFIDDIIIVIPEEYLDPQQIRELYNVLTKRKILILPAGRILTEALPDSYVEGL